MSAVDQAQRIAQVARAVEQAQAADTLWQVTCPKCGAAPGVGCGPSPRFAHAARRQAFAQARPRSASA